MGSDIGLKCSGVSQETGKLQPQAREILRLALRPCLSSPGIPLGTCTSRPVTAASQDLPMPHGKQGRLFPVPHDYVH